MSALVMSQPFRHSYMQLFDVRAINTDNAHGTRGAAAREGPGVTNFAALASTADGAMPHVRARLQRHNLRTVRDTAKQVQLALGVRRVQPPHLGSADALAGHFKPDQAVIGIRDAMLVNYSDAFKELTTIMSKTLRGSYLYENMAESRFVRSGKAVSIVDRVREHASAAEHAGGAPGSQRGSRADRQRAG
jgi:hypothetical protein